jgi:hypothetical protein
MDVSEHFLAFRRKSARFCEEGSGNLFSLPEMVAKLDPPVLEHARCITSAEIHDHYLSPLIQN